MASRQNQSSGCSVLARIFNVKFGYIVKYQRYILVYSVIYIIIIFLFPYMNLFYNFSVRIWILRK